MIGSPAFEAVFTLGNGDDVVMREDDIAIDDFNDIDQVVRKMENDQFWPNVWHINDHGNAALLAVNADGSYSIIGSWV